MLEASGHHIAIVDDEDLFRESLGSNLSDAGFRVSAFARGEPFLRTLAEDGGAGAAPDLVLLDWKMPGMSGIEVLRQLRGGERRLPVIFLTVLGDQIYEEAALTSGAVDFVEKSRSFSILLRRIELSLAAHAAASPAAETEQPTTLSCGDLHLQLRSKRAQWRKAQVDLSLTEFRIVHLIASRAGEDVSYREIYDLVHGEGFIAGAGEDGYRANVRTFIKRIRQKFRDVDPGFERIENYPGFGYRWGSDAASSS